jgi:hypothetical protein
MAGVVGRLALTPTLAGFPKASQQETSHDYPTGRAWRPPSFRSREVTLAPWAASPSSHLGRVSHDLPGLARQCGWPRRKTIRRAAY